MRIYHRALAALTCVALAGTSAGCSFLKSEGQIAKQDAIDCAKANLGQTVEDVGISLLREVISVIANGGADWQTDLNALEAHYGGIAVSCAEKIAVDLFKGAGNALPSTGTLTGDALAEQRAVQAIHGKTFR